MRVTLSQTVNRRLLIYSPATGGLIAPDATPTASVVRNGTVDGAVTVTVTSISTGRYKLSFTIPGSYAVDDVVELDASWAVSSVAGGRVWAMQVDATVNSRMASYTQPTGFLATTFPSGTVANTTNITGGTITTTTSVTNPVALTSAYDPSKTAAQAGDAMALTGGERTSLAGVIWSALTSGLTTAGSIGKRIVDYLTGDAFARLGAPAGASVSADVAAIKSETASIQSDTDALQSDVTTLLSRLTSTRAGYLDNLATAPPTASQITTAVWAASARTLTEKTGFSLTTAPPTAAEIKTAMEVTGGLLELANTRVQLALPAFAPGNNSGVARKSDVASGGGGSAGTLLIATPLRIVIPGARMASKPGAQRLRLNRGHVGSVRLDLVDDDRVPVPTTGTTLTAALVTSPGRAALLDLTAPTEVFGDEGQIEIAFNMGAAELVGKSQTILIITRENGDSDITTAELLVEIKG